MVTIPNLAPGVAIIPKALFPDVPNLPGVPLMARASPQFLAAQTAAQTVQGIVQGGPAALFPLAAANLPGGALAVSIAQKFLPAAPSSALFQSTQAAPVWGVFDQTGAQVITPDSVRVFDFRAGWDIARFPVQSGAFADYNKVTHPFENSVLLVKGGSQEARPAFLNQCGTVAGSLNLYNILTPEKQYLNVNCTRMELSRKEVAGAYFVAVELFFQQIQQVDAQYSTSGTQGTSTTNASAPSAVPPVNQGTVQAQPPTAQTATVVNSKLTTGQ